MKIKKIKILTIATLIVASLFAINCDAMRRGRGGRGGRGGLRGGGFRRSGFRGPRGGFRHRGRVVGRRRAFWGPRKRVAFRGRWGRPGWRRRRRWWGHRGWRRGPWRRNWWGPGAFWWRRPVFVGEPYWIDDRLRDDKGRTYWKVFNGTNRPLKFSSYDGSIVMLNPGETARVWRGESFEFAVVTPGGKLILEDQTSEHFIMIAQDQNNNFYTDKTNSKGEWRSWKG